MQLIRNGEDLSTRLKMFIKDSKNLFIFVPYIKLETLRFIVSESKCKLIVVRWKLNDIITGASDLEVYNFCVENNIKLFRNERLHLKAFIEDYKTCFLATSNISGKALNMPESSSYNYELATIVDSLSFEDRLYFSKILSEATLVTDSIFEQFYKQASNKMMPKRDDFEIRIKQPDKNFLISSLPLSNSVKTLVRIYLEKKGIHEEELNCAMHDLALYNIPLGLSKEQLLNQLNTAFKSHPFIVFFMDMMQQHDKQVYFGQAKAWIQDNCTDVPIPKKWEITENIQILYKWFKELYGEEFDVDRPNYSERLFYR